LSKGQAIVTAADLRRLEGLAIDRFARSGILVEGAATSGNKVECDE